MDVLVAIYQYNINTEPAKQNRKQDNKANQQIRNKSQVRSEQAHQNSIQHGSSLKSAPFTGKINNPSKGEINYNSL